MLERNDVVGGAATVYRHGALTIEASLHEIDGLDAGDPKLPLLHALGLDRDLAFVDVGALYEVRGGPVGAPFVLPSGPDGALAAAIARFPHHEGALERYFDAILAVRGAAGFAYAHMDDRMWWLRHLPEAAERLWPLIRHARATLGDVLRGLYGADEAVKCALAANLGYYHDDPERTLFLAFAVPQASYIAGGGHYVRGGSAALSARLAALIREADGVIETGREVDTLLCDGGRVVGASHRDRAGTDARIAFAPLVLANAAPAAVANLLPAADRATFMARYARRPISISYWTVALGLDRPPAAVGVENYSTWVLPPWMAALADLRDAASVMADPGGARLQPFVLADYHRIDSGLNAGPPYFCSFTGIDRLDSWSGVDAAATQARKQAWMERLIARLNKEFPGFAGAVTQREMSTAATMRQVLNTPGGAVLGFAPETLGGGPATPVDGLFLASAWTMGGGYTSAMLGGAAAARAALRSAAVSPAG